MAQWMSSYPTWQIQGSNQLCVVCLRLFPFPQTPGPLPLLLAASPLPSFDGTSIFCFVGVLRGEGPPTRRADECPVLEQSGARGRFIYELWACGEQMQCGIADRPGERRPRSVPLQLFFSPASSPVAPGAPLAQPTKGNEGCVGR